MLSDTLPPPFFEAATVPRLHWLVRLRWAALSGMVLGLVVARWLRLPWVAPGPIAAAVMVGALYNLWFRLRLERAPGTGEGQAEGGPRRFRELELHAVADVGALTLLLLACGGLRNPISMFYGFHVVLGAMLGFFRGALRSALCGIAGVGLLCAAERLGFLLSPPLLQPPLWLFALAVCTSILSLGYFSLGALRFLEREQGRALRNYELMLTGLDALHVGLELIGPGERVLLSNRLASAIHPCPDGTWRVPAGLSAGTSGRRLAHVDAEGESRIFEMVALGGAGPGPGPDDGGEGPLARDGLRAYLYVDRTESTVNEQRAIMLERLASLGRAMQGVAHELNTPLSSIQTLAVDLSHSVQSRDAAESISMIVDEARRCREITRELLASARMPQQHEGDWAKRRVRTVLRDVIARAAKLVFGFRPDKGLGGGLLLSGEPDLACVTDSDRLLQILVNLLQNARDASREGEPVEVLVQRSEDGARAVLEVRDHGPGLLPEVRARLFTPFVTSKPPGQGTGLGLYTCARLAQQLDAELVIEDAPGGGVRARLCLPRPLDPVTLESHP